MNAANDSESETNDSIWLELCVDGQSNAYELNADETRAVAVGSLLRADLRIDRPGVAPVHFHIEREGNDLWLVPAYGSHDLRVDTARLSGPQRIKGRAVIEFCGARIEARVHEQRPVVTRESSARLRSDDWSERLLESPSRVFEQRELGSLQNTDSALPNSDGALPTVAIKKFVSSIAPMPEQPTTRFAPVTNSTIVPVQRTVVIAPLRVIPLTSQPEGDKVPPTLRTGELPAQPIETTERLESMNNRLAQDTIQMAPFWMTELVPEQNAPSDLPLVGQSVHSPSATPTVSLSPGDSWVVKEPRQSQPHADTATTSYFEPFRISKAPFAAALNAGTQSTRAFDLQYVRTDEFEARGWLASLGLLSRRRPLLVWLVGTVTAFALTASIALLWKHHRQPSESHLRPECPAHSAVPSSSTTRAATLPHTSTGRVPEPIVVIPAATSVVTSMPKKGQSSNPELVAAVGHLMSGRYSDALVAYAALATQSPNDASLAVVSRLLAKKTDSKCSNPAFNSNISCPQVKP